MSLAPLQNIGLSELEAKIYELLIKNGETPISQVISETRLKRPTTYKILYSLQDKGLVTIYDVKKKLHARPESPAKLLELADKRSEIVEQARGSLQAFLPSLTSLYIQSTEQPVVKTFEGINGLKKIYENILLEGKPIYALVQAQNVEDELYKWLTTTYIRKRVRLKLHVRAIVASSKASAEYAQKSKEEYRITKLVDSSKFPIEHEIDVYGDKVAFIHYAKNEPLIGVVIHHPGIARTCKAWFDLAWHGADM